MVIEMCPCCGYENNFEWDWQTDGRKAHCLNCGNTLLICSLCDMDKVKCSKCKYK